MNEAYIGELVLGAVLIVREFSRFIGSRADLSKANALAILNLNENMDRLQIRVVELEKSEAEKLVIISDQSKKIDALIKIIKSLRKQNEVLKKQTYYLNRELNKRSQ